MSETIVNSGHNFEKIYAKARVRPILRGAFSALLLTSFAAIRSSESPAIPPYERVISGQAYRHDKIVNFRAGLSSICFKDYDDPKQVDLNINVDLVADSPDGQTNLGENNMIMFGPFTGDCMSAENSVYNDLTSENGIAVNVEQGVDEEIIHEFFGYGDPTLGSKIDKNISRAESLGVAVINVKALPQAKIYYPDAQIE